MPRFINCGICCCIFNVISCNDHRLVIFNVIPRNDHRLVCGFGLCHADRILLGLLRASSPCSIGYLCYHSWPLVSLDLGLCSPQLHHQSCSLYPDSTSSTLAIAGSIDTLHPRSSVHHGHLRGHLCWSSQTHASIHGGPYLHEFGIVNTCACIPPRRITGSSKHGTCLVLDGFFSNDFGIDSLPCSSSTVSPSKSKVHPCTPTSWRLLALMTLLWLRRHQQSQLRHC
jgi:hypothetical protein